MCRLLDGQGRVVEGGGERVMMPFLEGFEIMGYQLEQVWIEF